jgi:hypothetical protein
MKTLLAAALLAIVALPINAARAAPLAPLTFQTTADVVTVKDGCGIGFHRLPSGVCRPQPDGPRLMKLFARKCPLGYRRNVMGKCRRE